MEYRKGRRLNENDINIRNGDAGSRGIANNSAKKKATKKWSLGSLFKRRRTKSSDTDSSSSCEANHASSKKGILPVRSRRRRHDGGGSRRVVGKFEAKIINTPDGARPFGSSTVQNSSDLIERYDASPNVVIKNRYRAATPAPSNGGQEIQREGELTKGSCGLLESAGCRHERRRSKARIEARRMSMDDENSDDDNDDNDDDSGPSENCHSSRTSNSSLQRLSNEHLAAKGSSSNRKSRAARTDRYLRRHGRDEEAGKSASNLELQYSGVRSPVSDGSPKWVARVVYHQSSEFPFTSGAHSATCSPYNSPSAKAKTVYCSSLPSRPTIGERAEEYPSDSYYARIRSSALPKSLPPPPPPRNPNRKVTFPVDTSRPSSYAFDAYASPCEIVNFVQNGHPTDASLRRKSNSDLELRNLPRSGGETPSYPRENGSVKKYRADKQPRSRNPIQLVDEVSGREFAPSRGQLPLSKANEIGIPVAADGAGVVARSDSSKRAAAARPLSVVSERSDNELLNDDAERKASKRKPKNLEEALVELEEIYNSLKLSDEDLLDRAERRDLQSALRANPNFSRYSLSDLEGMGVVNGSRTMSSAEFLSSGLLSPRLPSGRRSAVPDTLADDMAYRKLNKKDGQEAKSTPNIVSQSGSFLLVSPTLSPPPLVAIPPPPPPPPTLSLSKEPDVTLDDVVFRNIRHTNNALKVLDPQPPFGIPLGPISPAANSDYLHAVPAERYRSTFNPSRTPDVVKDDLAFRNLRDDVKQEAKKRRAIRSLSANVVSLLGGKGNDHSDNENTPPLVDVNCSDFGKSARCISFDDLPDVLAKYRSQRWALLRNCDECLAPNLERSRSKRGFDLIANEAKMLRRKLRELEAIPPVRKVEQTNEMTSTTVAAAAVRRVALHKPITLSKFDIENVEEEKKKKKKTKTKNFGGNVDPRKVAANRGNHTKNYSNEFRLKYSDQNSVARTPPEMVALDVDQKPDRRSDVNVVPLSSPKRTVNFENSSSGVSSTSETPDSGAKSESSPTALLLYDSYRSFPSHAPPPRTTDVTAVGDRAEMVFFDENVFASPESASERFSTEELDDRGRRNRRPKNKDDVDERLPRNPEDRATRCSSIRIRLSTTEPSGTTISEIFPASPPNVDFIVFVVLTVACLHTFLFTNFSIFEILLVLISLLSYYAINRR